MPYCHNCGAEVNGNQEVCLSCGTLLADKPVTVYESNTFGWGLLGFCIPVAGLNFVFWFGIKNDQKRCKSSRNWCTDIFYIISGYHDHIFCDYH